MLLISYYLALFMINVDSTYISTSIFVIRCVLRWVLIIGIEASKQLNTTIHMSHLYDYFTYIRHWVVSFPKLTCTRGNISNILVLYQFYH